MPLSDPVGRRPIHTRRIECTSYERDDGQWDIDARLTDVKSYAFQNEFRGEVKPGEPIHDMRLRLTVDAELTVRAVEAKTDAGPFAVCPAINPAFALLSGLKIGPGWSRKVRELLGGVRGCTHLVDLLGPMATVAFHTVRWSRRAPNTRPRPDSKPPLDTCHAWARDGEIVRRRYPAFYTGAGDVAPPLRETE